MKLPLRRLDGLGLSAVTANPVVPRTGEYDSLANIICGCWMAAAAFLAEAILRTLAYEAL